MARICKLSFFLTFDAPRQFPIFQYFQLHGFVILLTTVRHKCFWNWKLKLNQKSLIEMCKVAFQLAICDWARDFRYKLFCVEFFWNLCRALIQLRSCHWVSNLCLKFECSVWSPITKVNNWILPSFLYYFTISILTVKPKPFWPFLFFEF